MAENFQTPEQKEDLRENKISLFLLCSIPWVFLVVMTTFLIFNFDKITAQDFVEDLGGVERVASMTTEELAENIERYFPKMRSEVEYASWYKKREKKITRIKYIFAKSDQGEWRDYKKSLHKGLKDFLMAKVFIEGQRDPVDIACFQGRFLFRNN